MLVDVEGQPKVLFALGQDFNGIHSMQLWGQRCCEAKEAGITQHLMRTAQ